MAWVRSSRPLSITANFAGTPCPGSPTSPTPWLSWSISIRPLPRWTRCWWRGSGRTPVAGRRTGPSGRCITSRTTPSPGRTHMDREHHMRFRRYVMSLTLVLVAAGCTDQTGPSPTAVPVPLAAVVPPPPGTHILQQSPTAPRLQTYQVSFWPRRGMQTTVFVNYRRRPGQWLPDPFLRFRIPINGLVAGAGGVPLARGDSVRITLTIDTVSFNVDFQPSGVLFSTSSPAQLAI